MDAAESFQNLLISLATGRAAISGEYARLRDVLMSQPMLEPYLPRFVRTSRDAHQFWQFISYEFGSYRERREYLWDEFRPLLEMLERGGPSPSDGSVSATLEQFDAAHVQGAWTKALERRESDPEGAITAARTLLEAVCKHILDEMRVSYDDSADLPKLYWLTAGALNLAPSQHTEQVFKQILGGCTSVVEGLGTLRNRLSDSHGKGKAGAKPAPRHAQLAVNLAGTMATFLFETWKSKEGGN
jgi:hypothetical protein